MVEGRRSLTQSNRRSHSPAIADADDVGGLTTGNNSVVESVCIRVRSVSPERAPPSLSGSSSQRLSSHASVLQLQSPSVSAGSLPLAGFFAMPSRQASASFVAPSSPSASYSPTGSASASYAPGSAPEFPMLTGAPVLRQSIRIMRAMSPGGVRYRSLSPRSAELQCGRSSPPIGGSFAVGMIAESLASQSRLLCTRRKVGINVSPSSPSASSPKAVTLSNYRTSPQSKPGLSTPDARTKSGMSTPELRIGRALSAKPCSPGTGGSISIRPGSRHPSSGSALSSAASSSASPGGPAASPKASQGQGRRSHPQAMQPNHCVDPLLARTPLSGPKGKKLGTSVLANRLRSTVGCSSWEPPVDVSTTSSTSSDWRNDLRPLPGLPQGFGHGPWPAAALAAYNTAAGSRAPAPGSCLSSTSAVPSQSSTSLITEITKWSVEVPPRRRVSSAHSFSEASLSDHSPAPREPSSPPWSARAITVPQQDLQAASPSARAHLEMMKTSALCKKALDSGARQEEVDDAVDSDSCREAVIQLILTKQEQATKLVVATTSGGYPPIRQTLRLPEACAPESEDAVETETRPPSSARGEYVPSEDGSPPVSARACTPKTQGPLEGLFGLRQFLAAVGVTSGSKEATCHTSSCSSKPAGPVVLRSEAKPETLAEPASFFSAVNAKRELKEDGRAADSRTDREAMALRIQRVLRGCQVRRQLRNIASGPELVKFGKVRQAAVENIRLEDTSVEEPQAEPPSKGQIVELPFDPPPGSTPKDVQVRSTSWEPPTTETTVRRCWR